MSNFDNDNDKVLPPSTVPPHDPFQLFKPLTHLTHCKIKNLAAQGRTVANYLRSI